MGQSVGLLAVSLFFALVGAVLGAALRHRHLEDSGRDRDLGR
jgi:hypothetical protein